MDTLGVFFPIQMSTSCFSDGLIVVNVTSFVSRHPARSKQGCPIGIFYYEVQGLLLDKQGKKAFGHSAARLLKAKLNGLKSYLS